MEPECRITGKVLDESGKPPSGARVMLSWGPGEIMNVPVDSKDGQYTADGLRSGRYTLNVLAGVGPGRSSEVVELGAGESLSKDIRINARRPGEAGARE